jgi:hypothetical protein
MNVNRAIPGAIVWLAATIAFKLNAIESLCLWAPLVVVPLGLELVPRGRLDSYIRPLQFSAAMFATASFAFHPSPRAALLAAPWALFCVALAIWGAARFFRRGRFDAVETCMTPRRVDRGGRVRPRHRAGDEAGWIRGAIVLLTAVHFHSRDSRRRSDRTRGTPRRPRRSIVLAGAAVVLPPPTSRRDSRSESQS